MFYQSKLVGSSFYITNDTLSTLKNMAFLFMFLDHIAIAFSQYEFLRIFGRFAFPIFAYVAVYNYRYNTSDHQKQFIFLMVFASISEIPYFLFFGFFQFNIFFTFLLSLFILYILEYEKDTYIKFIYVLFSFVMLYFCDYGFAGYFYIFFLNLMFKIFEDENKYSLELFLFMLFGLVFSAIFLNTFIIKFYLPTLFITFLFLINFFMYFEIKFLNFRLNRFFYYSIYPFHLFILFLFK